MDLILRLLVSYGWFGPFNWWFALLNFWIWAVGSFCASGGDICNIVCLYRNQLRGVRSCQLQTLWRAWGRSSLVIMASKWLALQLPRLQITLVGCGFVLYDIVFWKKHSTSQICVVAILFMLFGVITVHLPLTHNANIAPNRRLVDFTVIMCNGFVFCFYT